jgi:hypothetical protein
MAGELANTLVGNARQTCGPGLNISVPVVISSERVSMRMQEPHSPIMVVPYTRDGAGVHLGGGETQPTGDLPTGSRELQLLVGDHEHMPHDPVVKSDRITVEVIGSGGSVCEPLRGGPSSCEPAGE